MITTVIKRLFPSEEQQHQTARIRYELEREMLKNSKSFDQLSADIVNAEVRYGNWIQRSWRPASMLILFSLIVAYWIGWSPDNLSQDTIDHLFDIVKVGFGGYIVGRSGEKIMHEYRRGTPNGSGQI